MRSAVLLLCPGYAEDSLLTGSQEVGLKPPGIALDLKRLNGSDKRRREPLPPPKPLTCAELLRLAVWFVKRLPDDLVPSEPCTAVELRER